MEIKDRLSTNFGRLLAEVMHSMQSGTPKEQLIATMNIYEYHMKLKSRIAELEAKQRWIPVSERLPEEFTLVLTIGKDNLPVAAVVDRGHWYSSFEYSLNVTHWMTLPEPPEDFDNEPA